MNKLFQGVTISMEWKSYTTIRNLSYIVYLNMRRSRYLQRKNKKGNISIKMPFKIRLFKEKHLPVGLQKS